jgi:hypothetical protein
LISAAMVIGEKGIPRSAAREIDLYRY